MKTVTFPFGAETRIVPITARYGGAPSYRVEALKTKWLFSWWVPVCVCIRRDQAEEVIWHLEQDADA